MIAYFRNIIRAILGRTPAQTQGGGGPKPEK